MNNQTVTTLGTKVEPGDLVTVDGTLVSPPERTSWYLAAQADRGGDDARPTPRDRPTVASLLADVEGRVFPWGGWTGMPRERCCSPTTAAPAHRLLHPSFEVPGPTWSR